MRIRIICIIALITSCTNGIEFKSIKYDDLLCDGNSKIWLIDKMIVDKVSGIGPKIALNLLGSLSLPTLKNSIAQGDVGMLSKAQGLGKKTAERIVVELKDKVLPKGSSIPSGELSRGSVARESSSIDNGGGQDLSAYGDAVSALLTLGYKATEADQAIRRSAEALGKNCSTEELIRKALGR